MNYKLELEERLIQFAAKILQITEGFPPTYAGNYLASQLIRSGTSPALNYAEAQAAESRSDFIHKMKIALKELKETYCCLRIIQKQNWLCQLKLSPILNENNQLISIFVKSLLTAQNNKKISNLPK